MFCREVGGHQAGVVAFYGEVDHADGVGVRIRVLEDLVDGDTVDLLQAFHQEGADG